jgi:glycosyltransferase involved in cell wall biosynthesis
MLANARAMVRLVRAQGVDLIHARSRAPAWSALLAARHARVPFVTTYHGAYGETNAAKRFYNSVMARGDVVIANSNYTADLIAQRYSTARTRINVIHRGVGTHEFDPARIGPGRVASMRSSWGVHDSTRVILQAARLTSWKGQSVLIDAAARLKATGKLEGAVIVLAGDAQGRDAYVQGLHAQVAHAGLERHVRFAGHVEDMAAAYLAAHATVVASTEPEAFGRAAIEAAAMGSPVIATAIGAPPETVLAEPAVVEAAATGWLVPPGDAGTLAERLAGALALSERERSAMAARARAHVVAQFTVNAMQRRTLAVYDRLLGTFLERRFVEGCAQAASLDTPPRKS